MIVWLDEEMVIIKFQWDLIWARRAAQANFLWFLGLAWLGPTLPCPDSETQIDKW